MVNIVSVVLILIGSFIGAIGTFLIKRESGKYSFFSLIFTKLFFLSMVLYAISVLVYIIVLQGEELSVVYPLVSFTYIWTTLFSVKYLGEKMNSYKLFGLFGIILGIVMIGIGS